MKFIFDTNEIRVDTDTVARLFIKLEEGYFPKVDWECCAADFIKEALSGVIKLWTKNDIYFQADFVGIEVYDFDVYLSLIVTNIQSGNWLIQLGKFNYDKSEMDVVVYKKTIKARIFASQIKELALKLIDVARIQNSLHFIKDIQLLIKQADKLKIPPIR